MYEYGEAERQGDVTAAVGKTKGRLRRKRAALEYTIAAIACGLMWACTQVHLDAREVFLLSTAILMISLGLIRRISRGYGHQVQIADTTDQAWRTGNCWVCATQRSHLTTCRDPQCIRHPIVEEVLHGV